MQSMSASAPTVIGLYGLPGTGKTTLLSWLKKILDRDAFACYEGSEVLTSLVTGGLAAFKALSDLDKQSIRNQAINKIQRGCGENEKTAIVTGHFSFKSTDQNDSQAVFSNSDASTYTHIIYLDVAPARIAHQCRNDGMRDRDLLTIQSLENWQRFEMNTLEDLCRKHNIVFTKMSALESGLLPPTVAQVLKDYHRHEEEQNLNTVLQKVCDIVKDHPPRKTYLVLDADRTLNARDTSSLFAIKTDPKLSQDLETIFKTFKYTFCAFSRAVLAYEAIATSLSTKEDFDEICVEVANGVEMHSKILTLLNAVAEHDHIGVIVITCGLRAIWQNVIRHAGLHSIDVIGGGRFTDGYVVTPEVKGAVVDALRTTHGAYVWAFGDSPLDLEMLKKADEAVVVTGEEQWRSKTMDSELQVAIHEGLKASQVLLPPRSSPRLDLASLPIIQLSDPDLITTILQHRGLVLHTPPQHVQKLLATPMRDANVSGPKLQDAHRCVGWYLATHFLPGIIGTETYEVPHVQGNTTEAHRLLDENRTLIVPLMRGGEPMAFGIWNAFPLAVFLHAKDTNDITQEHLNGVKTVVLVDSVVNSGKSMADFVEAVRDLDCKIRIVVVAGVVQAAVIKHGVLKDAARKEETHVVALRVSENSFVGRKTTDTGNRLFNSTHLE